MRKTASIPAASLGIFLCLFALWIAAGVWLHGEARGCDLLNLYTGARLTLAGQGPHLYEPEVQLSAERAIYPTPVLRPFVRPPFYGLLISPLGLIPYRYASWLMVGMMLAMAAAGSLWLGRAHRDAIVLPAMFLPLWIGLALGQDCAVYFLVAMAGFALHKRGSDFVAGAVFALLLAKFHLILLLPVMMIVQRRWRMFQGFSMVGILLALVSLAVSGVAGIRQYVLFITADNPLIHNTPQRMVNLWSLLLNLHAADRWVLAAGISLVLAAVLRTLLRHRDWRAFAACFAGSAVIAPHVYSYDLAASIPFLCMAALFATRKAVKIAATLVFLPLPYILAGGGTSWAALAPALLAATVILLAFEPAPVAEAGTEPVPEVYILSSSGCRKGAGSVSRVSSTTGPPGSGGTPL